MQRRHPIAWDCTTDEIREKFYNGMAEELDWTWKEIKRLRTALKPFAEHADVYDCWGPERDGSPLQTEHVEGGEEFDFTIGDLRNARSALIEQQGLKEKE